MTPWEKDLLDAREYADAVMAKIENDEVSPELTHALLWTAFYAGRISLRLADDIPGSDGT
jgi:hypothetical protein